MRSTFDAISRFGKRAEDGLLVLAFLALVVLAGLQILLRNVFDSGLAWIDPVLRILVLWVAMLGAVAASRDNRHINIDVLSRLLPDDWLAWTRRITALVTAVICALLAWHTFRFVRDEYSYSDMEVAGVPVWLWQSILPLGFALMARRFAVTVIHPPTGAHTTAEGAETE